MPESFMYYVLILPALLEVTDFPAKAWPLYSNGSALIAQSELLGGLPHANSARKNILIGFKLDFLGGLSRLRKGSI